MRYIRPAMCYTQEANARPSSAIQGYLIEIKVRKYTPKTIKGYRTNLVFFLRFCEEIAFGPLPFARKNNPAATGFKKHYSDILLFGNGYTKGKKLCYNVQDSVVMRKMI